MEMKGVPAKDAEVSQHNLPLECRTYILSALNMEGKQAEDSWLVWHHEQKGIETCVWRLRFTQSSIAWEQVRD